VKASPYDPIDGMPYTVIIPTRKEKNLIPCVEAIEGYNPGILRDVFVVDDDEMGNVERCCAGYGLTRAQGIKPFVYARNVNLGLGLCLRTGRDAIVLNDDALLETQGGFDALSYAANCLMFKPYGVVGATVRGAVGCQEQMYMQRMKVMSKNASPLIHLVESHTVAFVCVYLRHAVIANVGLLDERFDRGYGFEDSDYCHRTRKWGYQLGVYDGCVVEHGISLKSTFRHGDDGTPRPQSLEPGLEIFKQIHGCLPGEWK